MRGLIVFLLALTTAAAFGQYGVGMDVDSDAAFTSPEFKKIGVDQKLGDVIDLTASVTDDNGKPTQFGTLLRGKPVIVLPIFYRCTGVCNLELNGVIDALRQMPKWKVGRDVDVVALGLHPKETYDLASAKKSLTLRQYKDASSAPGWHFLTGDQDQVEKIAKSLGFRYVFDEKGDRVNHPTGVMVLTGTGKVSAYILSATFSPDRLGGFLETARKGEIGQKTQEIFFGCIHIDPVTGKRSIMIENVLKVFGVITLISVIGSILVLSGKVRLRNRA